MMPTRTRVRHQCWWSVAGLRPFALAAALSMVMAAFATVARAEGERLRGAQFINVLNGNTITPTSVPMQSVDVGNSQKQVLLTSSNSDKPATVFVGESTVTMSLVNTTVTGADNDDG